MAIADTAQIHPTAVIAEGAQVAAKVTVGAYAVIGSDVSIGNGTEVKSHVCIDGWTQIGAENTIFPFASLGQQPQDLKFSGERTLLKIGDKNTIREYVTMNPGTAGGGGETRVGNGNLFMNHVHIGHDCIVGNDAIFANAATLGGHVNVGDGAVLGGLAAVHQFCRIGRGAMIGGMAGVVADVIPFGMVMGERAHLAGLNLVGLKRRGARKDEMHELRGIYARLFEGEGTLTDRVSVLLDEDHGTLVAELLEFIGTSSSRRITTPR